MANTKIDKYFLNLAQMAVFCLLIAFAGETATAQERDPGDVLAGLDKAHPRLMIKDADLAHLKKLAETDTALRKIVSDLIKNADACVEKSPPVYKKIGPRLLSVSRDCLEQTYALALAWRWTGDEKYARRAKENLLAVCKFSDWNPSHFLDTAEMSHAVGLGYDWLYSSLSPEERSVIKAALIRHGLQPGLDAYKKNVWWAKSPYNWNQVCNGGLLVGALAIADTDPDIAQSIVASAVKSLPHALASYAPDGGWPEGPGYWSYASSYTAYGLTALQTALGHDFGLSKTPGLSLSGLFPIYTAGPTGLFLNFADSGENARRGPNPSLFWFARTYDNPFLADNERAVLTSHSARPQHLIWYAGPVEHKAMPAPPLDKHYRGAVELAIFRSAWDDPNALFVGIKAGFNSVSHAHLDLGNFELDALGVRWTRDLGSDDYNLPDYFGNKRYTYYRLRSASHNVPMLAGKDQAVQGKAKFTKFVSREGDALVVVDMTTAYPDASKATRGVALVSDRKAVLVQDEFELKKPAAIAWGMTTDAEIALQPDGSAELKLKGKVLVARILGPETAHFSIESAEQKPPERPNTGVRRLVVKMNERGSVRIAILFLPAPSGGAEFVPPKIKPLAEW